MLFRSFSARMNPALLLMFLLSTRTVGSEWDKKSPFPKDEKGWKLIPRSRPIFPGDSPGWNWHLDVGFAGQPVAVVSSGQIPQPLLMRMPPKQRHGEKRKTGQRVNRNLGFSPDRLGFGQRKPAAKLAHENSTRQTWSRTRLPQFASPWPVRQ